MEKRRKFPQKQSPVLLRFLQRSLCSFSSPRQHSSQFPVQVAKLFSPAPGSCGLESKSPIVNVHLNN